MARLRSRSSDIYNPVIGKNINNDSSNYALSSMHRSTKVYGHENLGNDTLHSYQSEVALELLFCHRIAVFAVPFQH